jgi:hypothetical protein
MKLQIVKPQTQAEKRTGSALDTLDITEARIKTWRAPPFQRPLRVNDKLQSIAKLITEDGVIPGVITLGVLDGDLYLLDGQHRIEGFRISGIPIAYADVRFLHCESMGQMGQEFVRLNSRIVNIRPDDILRGLEGSSAVLQSIRRMCPFVGYDMIRRSERAPLVSMSMAIRMWMGSEPDVPAPRSMGIGTLIEWVSEESAGQLVDFLACCYQAWGRDVQYAKLWGFLNMILCAWLYRRLVVSQHSPKSPRLSRDTFTKCLMSLSAETHYLDWLVGRNLGERDRSPAYDRIKRIFADRLTTEMGKRPLLPAPAWAVGK